MKYFVIITFFLFVFQAFGQKISKPDLTGCWTESREENTRESTSLIYRPCDYKTFPPSRFRFRMELRNDSKCSWLVPAINDGHCMQDGTWTFNEETRELRLFDMEGNEVHRFIIIAAGDKLLKIRK